MLERNHYTRRILWKIWKKGGMIFLRALLFYRAIGRNDVKKSES